MSRAWRSRVSRHPSYRAYSEMQPAIQPAANIVFPIWESLCTWQVHRVGARDWNSRGWTDEPVAWSRSKPHRQTTLLLGCLPTARTSPLAPFRATPPTSGSWNHLAALLHDV